MPQSTHYTPDLHHSNGFSLVEKVIRIAAVSVTIVYDGVYVYTDDTLYYTHHPTGNVPNGKLYPGSLLGPKVACTRRKD